MEVKKVLLIRSSHYNDKGAVVKSQTLVDRFTNLNYAELGLPMIAASTPKHIEVEMHDDCLDPGIEQTDAQVVGISAMLIHIDRARDLARKFRDQGKVVVMGGFLPSLYPHLVKDWVDAICIGDGESTWPQILRDIELDQLKKEYIDDHSGDLDHLPTPRYDLIKHNRLTIYPVQATRGCMHHCQYCSVITFYKNKYRVRPIDQVIKDIEAHGSKRMYFTDDNLMDHTRYAKDLFRAMRGAKVKWGLQASPKIAADPELLDLAREAGCVTTAIGFETIRQDNLQGLSKNWAQADNYQEAIQRIQDHGINVHALIMYGLDSDTESSFDQTIKFLISNKVTSADFFILTPYPATPLGREYLRNDRIIDHNLAHYREPHVVFKHPTLSGNQIRDGFWDSYQNFYSLKSMFTRLKPKATPNKLFAYYSNFYYRRKIRNKIVPTHNQRGDYTL